MPVRFGNPAICCVTGPGENAVFQTAHFAQDVEYIRNISQLLAKNYGLEYIGGFHSHLNKFGEVPSPGDDNTIKSFCKKNGFHKWLTIIVTHEYYNNIKSLSTQSTKIYAYIYTDTGKGTRVRVPLQILPGEGPFQMALINSRTPELTSLCRHAANYPIGRITYDKYKPQKAMTKEDDATCWFPSKIIKQIENMPLRVQKNVNLWMEEKSIAVKFNVYESKQVTVYYHNTAPYDILDVTLEVGGKLESIFSCFSLAPRGLKQIYNLMRSSRSRLNKVIRKKSKRLNKKNNRPWR